MVCWRCKKPKGKNKGEWYCQCWRPTTRKEEYTEMVDQYLEQCRDEYIERTKTEWKGSITKERQIVVKLPTQEWYYMRLNGKYNTTIAISTWKDWKSKHRQFSDALERIHLEQRTRLLDNWLSGSYNSTIAKLILSANHGMSETNRTDLTSNWQTVWVIELPKKRDD